MTIGARTAATAKQQQIPFGMTNKRGLANTWGMTNKMPYGVKVPSGSIFGAFVPKSARESCLTTAIA